MSSKYFRIPIHVKPYVKKYIIANYGDVILVSIKNPVSTVLYGFLQKQNIPFREDRETINNRFNKLSQTFYLMLRKRDKYTHGLFIHPTNQLLINNYFEQEIFKRIFNQCEVYTKVNLPLVTAIEDFCEKYNIELHIDISLEAILKAEYRYRQNKKNLNKDIAVLSDL